MRIVKQTCIGYQNDAEGTTSIIEEILENGSVQWSTVKSVYIDGRFDEILSGALTARPGIDITPEQFEQNRKDF